MPVTARSWRFESSSGHQRSFSCTAKNLFYKVFHANPLLIDAHAYQPNYPTFWVMNWVTDGNFENGELVTQLPLSDPKIRTLKQRDKPYRWTRFARLNVGFRVKPGMKRGVTDQAT